MAIILGNHQSADHPHDGDFRGVAIFQAFRHLLLCRNNIALEPALLPVTVYLMRIMLLSPIIFGISGIIMAAP